MYQAIKGCVKRRKNPTPRNPHWFNRRWKDSKTLILEILSRFNRGFLDASNKWRMCKKKKNLNPRNPHLIQQKKRRHLRDVQKDEKP